MRRSSSSLEPQPWPGEKSHFKKLARKPGLHSSRRSPLKGLPSRFTRGMFAIFIDIPITTEQIEAQEAIREADRRKATTLMQNIDAY